ncbi:MAG: PIN domain-containing protein [Planctomycetota bacterium]|jgi:predicted nucleic acid-binding protein|nr:PIN domain-containing protein [Planctomycetota bacterium]
MGIIIDTCVWIGLADGDISGEDVFDKVGDAEIFCSVITIGELEFGLVSCADSQKIGRRQRLLDALLAEFPIMNLATTTAKIFGRLATLLKKKTNPRSCYNDLWLAAQAVEAGFSLLTDNKNDFKNLPELQLLTL